jgi:hypothetical protein
MPRPNWSRPLPRPLVIPGVTPLKTLADVRALIEKRLPKEHREKSTWRHVAARLDEAARGGGDTVDVAVPLQIVLLLEGVECRPK